MKHENQSLALENKLIQSHFVKAIFERNETDLMKQIRQDLVSPEFRISIYRNTIFQNLCSTLKITFPAIWKLVGDDCANSLAYAFCQQQSNLPLTNCLDDWGANFPQFLQKMAYLTQLYYLKDVAELEWLKHQSYRAPNYKYFDLQKLQKNLVQAEKLQLIFNPSVYLFSSDYLLKEVIYFIENPHAHEMITLEQSPSYAVVFRHRNQVSVRWISQDMFYFFINIKNRFSLGKSYEIIRKSNPDFDLSATLQLVIQYHLISNIKK